MHRFATWIIIFLLVSVGNMSENSLADISLPKIFSDHMVLQQNSNVTIWGAAEPGDELVISFIDQTVNATADAEGNWSAKIKTPVAGGPYEISISAIDGDPKIIISDVMIGEVWICSGQSNMEWPVKDALNPSTEIEQSKMFSSIRFFTVDQNTSAQPLSEFTKAGPWDCCSPETVQDFSAVAFFFGRELHKELNVPIGLIDVSYGGTRAEAWVSRGALDRVESLQPMLKHWEENDNPTSKDRPANLFNGMIAPLKGYNFRGAIWYQGESNVGRGFQYQALFPTLIEDWRQKLSEGAEFPFYFVQLAPFRYQDLSPEALPELWDAQLKTFNSVEGVGMVVTTDVGDVKDIHPRNKQVVGQRLSLWALAKTYADQIAADKVPQLVSGPIFASCAFRENEVRISFNYSEGGLKSSDGKLLTHFTICGEDKKFFPANAVIEGEVVVVSSPEVPNPKYVRFAWDDTAEPNLTGASGLPASPFRTDNFPLLSVGNDY